MEGSRYGLQYNQSWQDLLKTKKDFQKYVWDKDSEIFVE